jgi:S1-C subfamily serine protease
MKKGIVIGLFLGVLMTGLVFLVLNKKETINIKKEIVDEESMVTRVVEKAIPSVVTIKIEKDIGTGFIVSNDGLIVTNKHVVADTQAKYKVVIGNNEEVEVINIYRDPLNDLAILKINKNNLVTLDLGDSDVLKAGQSVIAIGTALGEFRSTVTTGVISGLGRGITAGVVGELEKLSNVIQTDAAINPGNSGGPLFNSSGEVIGVNVAVSQNGQNIGFALPINLIKESIDYFRKTGEFERPYLGVGYKMMEKGAWVESILENSPASKSELKIGDIISQIDGEKLDTLDNGVVVKIINKKKIGDVIEVKIWREKIEKTISVILEKKIN